MAGDYENIYITSARTGLRFRVGLRDRAIIDSTRTRYDGNIEYLMDRPTNISIEMVFMASFAHCLFERLAALKAMAGDVHLKGCGFDGTDTYDMLPIRKWTHRGGCCKGHELTIDVHFENHKAKPTHIFEQGRLIDLNEKPAAPWEWT